MKSNPSRKELRNITSNTKIKNNNPKKTSP